MNSALLAKALEMPVSEKIELAELILASVAEENSEISEAWNQEAHARLKSVSKGKSKLVDFEDVFKD